MDFLLGKGVEGLIDLYKLDQLLSPFVDDDVVLVRAPELLLLNLETVRLGSCQVLGQRRLLFRTAILLLSFDLFGLRVVVYL